MTEYLRIRLEDLDGYLMAGWRVVGRDGKPLVEGWGIDELLTCVVERDVPEEDGDGAE